MFLGRFTFYLTISKVNLPLTLRFMVYWSVFVVEVDEKQTRVMVSNYVHSKKEITFIRKKIEILKTRSIMCKKITFS